MVKTIIGIMIVAICLLLIGAPTIFERVHAAAALAFPNLNQLTDKLPQPVRDLINSAKQVGGSATDGASSKNSGFSLSNVGPIDPSAWPGDVNSWFTNTTGGVSLFGIIKTAGNLLVWVLDSTSGLIKWGLSFLH